MWFIKEKNNIYDTGTRGKTLPITIYQSQIYGTPVCSSRQSQYGSV